MCPDVHDDRGDFIASVHVSFVSIFVSVVCCEFTAVPTKVLSDLQKGFRFELHALCLMLLNDTVEKKKKKKKKGKKKKKERERDSGKRPPRSRLSTKIERAPRN